MKERRRQGGAASKGRWQPPLLAAGLLLPPAAAAERGPGKGPAVELCGHLPVTARRLPPQTLPKPGAAGRAPVPSLASPCFFPGSARLTPAGGGGAFLARGGWRSGVRKAAAPARRCAKVAIAVLKFQLAW